jgi:hypothetical protein
MEWTIVHLVKELHPEGRAVQRSDKMTAGHVARQLQSAISETKVSNSAYSDAKAIANEYGDLLKRRSEILHAHPATISGEQRLHRVRADGTHDAIKLDDLVAFSGDCTGLSNRASALLWKLRKGQDH